MCSAVFFENFTSKTLLPLFVFELFPSNCFLLLVDALFVVANDSFVVMILLGLHHAGVRHR